MEGTHTLIAPETHTLNAAGQPRLHVELWRAESPRATVVLAPGLGDHCGRYGHIAMRVAGEMGLADVVGFDFRGHGRSEGKRGVVGSYRDLVDDLARVVDWARGRSRGGPLFILGHSNGGLVTLAAVLDGRIDVDGVILSAPALRLKARVPGWKLWAGRMLQVCAPWVTLGGRLPAASLTRDPRMQAERRNDALVHCRLSPPIFFGMRETGARVLARAAEFTLPMLVIVGGEDPVIDPEASIDFINRVGGADRTIEVVSGGVHEPLHDLGWEAVVERIGEWLGSRVEIVMR